jgi:hypothetical protein
LRSTAPAGETIPSPSAAATATHKFEILIQNLPRSRDGHAAIAVSAKLGKLRVATARMDCVDVSGECLKKSLASSEGFSSASRMPKTFERLKPFPFSRVKRWVHQSIRRS